jgi:hypothetical protein
LRQGEKESILVLVNLSNQQVEDVNLSLASGPLKGQYRAQDLLSEQKLAVLKASAAGGFDSYKLPVLEPYQQLVIYLK